MDYILSYQGREIGNVHVIKKGLYYHIKCRFSRLGAGPFHLIAATDSREVDLGICMQCEYQFGLERHLPIKTVGESLRRFYITTEEVSAGIRVSEEKPFPYVAHLEAAVLVIKNDEKLIKI